MPQNTDLVTDLPADFEVFGQAVATSMADLLGGTSGQILAKNSNTDMDFVWVANDQGDITGVTAGNGISVTDPTGPVPTVAINTAVTADLTTAQTLTNKTLTSPVLTTPSISNINAKADVLVGTADNTLGILSVGTNGQVLTADSTVSPTGLKWATPASGSTFAGTRVVNSTDQSISNATQTTLTWNTETFDTDAFHSTSSNTGRITIPAGKAGYYRLSANLTFAKNATGERFLILMKNGTKVNQQSYGNFGSGAYISMSFTDVIYLAVADYVELQTYQDSGGALSIIMNNGGVYESQFAANYLGA
jgi:hypothetical protein